MTATNPLVEQVLAGGNRQLQELAAAGLLPLPPEQLIPLQVKLARGSDEELAGRAAASLRDGDARRTAPYLERDAGPDELAFFAAEVSHPLVLETILRRRDVPRALLVELAGRLPADLQEVLLLRQDAILEEPAILTALESNAQITPYSQRRIIEYREHLLPHRTAAPSAAAEEVEDPLADPVVRAAIEEVRGVAAAGDIEERTGLSEGEIRMLPVPVRMRLTRGASRLMKSILVRDSNAIVALSVLRNNTFSDQEIEQIARSRSVVEDVLLAVSKHRQWMSRYGVVKGLALNPRTPIGVAVRLVSRLSVRDLREASRDRNIPDAVRSNAQRLYTIKRQ